MCVEGGCLQGPKWSPNKWRVVVVNWRRLVHLVRREVVVTARMLSHSSLQRPFLGVLGVPWPHVTPEALWNQLDHAVPWPLLAACLKLVDNAIKQV